MPDREPCEGFHWIGQPFYCCDNCGRPAWEHVGMHRPGGPFTDEAGHVEPWKPGEAEGIREKWEPGWHDAAGCHSFRGAVTHGPNCPTREPEPEPEQHPGPTVEQIAEIRAEFGPGDWPGEIHRLRLEVDELLAELDGRDEKARKRWIKKQQKALSLRSLEFREGRWEMALDDAREMAAAYTAMAKSLLGDGPNYSETKIEFDVKVAEQPELYTIVVQRHAPSALTPHEARQRAEAERDAARDELIGLKEWADAEQTSKLEYLDHDGTRWLYLGPDSDGQPLMQIAPYSADDSPMRLRDLLDDYGPLTPVMPEGADHA